ncbi:MAG: transcriptional regulator [Burkholderiaceae bacterium]
MELKAYLKLLPDESAREKFAKDAGTTLGHLRNVSYGLRAPAAELCTQLEAASHGALTRRGLRPDDWYRIWPELITTTSPEAA